MTMRDLPAELGSMFDASETAEIESNRINLSESTTVDAFDLALSWASKVRKIDLDRALPRSDRTVWNEHDLAGMMFWRDHLQRSVDQLRPALRTRMERFVADADSRFRSITVEDSGQRMASIAGVTLTDRSWWWHRVPNSGPIAEDLDEYSTA
jgi:hypothetical protein